ncbi:MAG: ZIP family metal transporter, partial [Candidatus Woesearchaeota archaeon]
MELLTILIATLLVSAISLIGAVTLFLGKKKVQKVMIYLVAFAAGVLLATSVMHLIPESLGVHSHLEHHYDDHAYQIYSHTDHQHTQHNDSDHAHDEKDHDDHDKEHHKEHHEHHHEAWFMNPALFILVGVLLFFGIERYVHWHHHHDVLCEHHHLTPMVIIGD